jgi:hypothetical protein
MLKTRCATIALFALGLPLANPALAADCASPAEAAALKTAVMQQELMVAALQCHEAGAYNRFVINYRGELQSSDAALKAFFVRRGGEHGEAGYDTFKTKAANLSALEQARDAQSFCADAHALFGAALANQGSLMSFVGARAGATNIGNVCVESRPAPLAVRAEIKPVPAPVKVANAQPAIVAVGGVPTFNEPAIPYRQANAAPPPAAAPAPAPVPVRDVARNDDEEDAAPTYANADENDAPPPRPRYYQIRERSYDNNGYGAYAPPPPRNYGPPPGWGQQGWGNYPAPPPPPGYGWYPRNGYYNW